MQNNLRSKISILCGVLVILLLFVTVTMGNQKNVSADLSPNILFGLGTEAADVIDARLVKEAPVKMLTSWYNSPEDLTWMDDSWHLDMVKNTYAQGYTHHVITFTDGPATQFETSDGPACGREYPTTAAFVSDMEKLATIYKGTGPLYMTLSTEFQDYPCQSNQWQGNENYFNALKSKYLEAMTRIRAVNPNAHVSLGWGGWQSRFDDPSTGSGKSLFTHFADIMQQSQFESFQAMQSDSNVQDIKDMSKILGQYGPVMVAHLKPDNVSQSTFDSDVRTILTKEYLQEVKANGLFAISFMDDVNMNNDENLYQFIKDGVTKFAINENMTENSSTPISTVTQTPSSTPTTTNSPVVQTNSPEPTVIANTINPTSSPITQTATPSPTSKATITPSITPSPTVVPTITTIVIPTPNPTQTQTSSPIPTTRPSAPLPTIDSRALLGVSTAPIPTSKALVRVTPINLATSVPIPDAEPNVSVLSPVVDTTDKLVEERSIIKIFAEGTQAFGTYPTMKLLVDNKIMQTFDEVGAYHIYSYIHPAKITADQIAVAFTNDFYFPIFRIDRNLRIDKIMLDDESYETESPDVLSKGSWSAESACSTGHKASEWLHCNGWVKY